MGGFGGSGYMHRFCVKFVEYNFKELCIIAVFVINLHCFKMVCLSHGTLHMPTSISSLVFYYLTENKRKVWLCCFVVLNFKKSCLNKCIFSWSVILHIVRSLNYILFPYHKSISAHVVTECKKFKKSQGNRHWYHRHIKSNENGSVYWDF